MDRFQEIISSLQLLVGVKMKDYAKISGEQKFRHYGQKVFQKRSIRQKEYFGLLETVSLSGGEVIFVSNMFKVIPEEQGEAFPKSIRFRCFWRKETGGRWQEVRMKANFLHELEEVVDLDGVNSQIDSIVLGMV